MKIVHLKHYITLSFVLASEYIINDWGELIIIENIREQNENTNK